MALTRALIPTSMPCWPLSVPLRAQVAALHSQLSQLQQVRHAQDLALTQLRADLANQASRLTAGHHAPASAQVR